MVMILGPGNSLHVFRVRWLRYTNAFIGGFESTGKKKWGNAWKCWFTDYLS
jgi:hypothetical protein